MAQQQVRQGDVFVSPTQSRPSAAAKSITDNDRVVLAYGEVTGHAHEVVADEMSDEMLPASALFEEPDGARFLIVNRPCTLRHEEHGPIALAPGAYRVIRQREYSPEEIRNVAD